MRVRVAGQQRFAGLAPVGVELARRRPPNGVALTHPRPPGRTARIAGMAAPTSAAFIGTGARSIPGLARLPLRPVPLARRSEGAGP